MNEEEVFKKVLDCVFNPNISLKIFSKHLN